MREPLPRLAACVAVVLLSVTTLKSAARGDTASERTSSVGVVVPNVGGATSGADAVKGAGAARAASSRSPAIGGSSSCPAPEAVWSELETLLPNDVLAERVTGLPGLSPTVQIDDLGASYRVLAAGRLREYRDEGRDCAHRARVAALFIALTFEPPSAESAAAPASATPVVNAEVPPAEGKSGRRFVRLDIGLTGNAGWGASGHIIETGAAVRAAFGAGTWALVLAAAALLPSNAAVTDLRVRHWRLPADVALRFQGNGHTVAPYVEAGVALALLRERARDLAINQSQTAWEVGAFAGVGLRFFSGARFAPFVALRMEVVPDPPTIEALPRGEVGHTPSFWAGASAGMSIDF